MAPKTKTEGPVRALPVVTKRGCWTTGLLGAGGAIILTHLADAGPEGYLTRAVGAAVMVAGWVVICWARSFGVAEARVEPETIGDGDSFLFDYRKPVHHARCLRVSTTFVLRERVVEERAGEKMTLDQDQTVFVYGPERFNALAGDVFQTTLQFRVPPYGVDTFAGNDLSPHWIVKVQIQPELGPDVWDEFEILVSPYPPQRVPRDYEVVLVSSSRSSLLGEVGTVLSELLPDLMPDQLGRVYWQMPVIVLKTRSFEEARIACAKLVAAGGKAEVHHADKVVEAPTERSLPIPGESPSCDVGTLPLPASRTVADNPPVAVREPGQSETSEANSDAGGSHS